MIIRSPTSVTSSRIIPVLYLFSHHIQFICLSNSQQHPPAFGPYSPITTSSRTSWPHLGRERARKWKTSHQLVVPDALANAKHGDFSGLRVEHHARIVLTVYHQPLYLNARRVQRKLTGRNRQVLERSPARYQPCFRAETSPATPGKRRAGQRRRTGKRRTDSSWLTVSVLV